jgi:hypothetical protein
MADPQGSASSFRVGLLSVSNIRLSKHLASLILQAKQPALSTGFLRPSIDAGQGRACCVAQSHTEE